MLLAIMDIRAHPISFCDGVSYGERALLEYRCYFLGPDGKILARCEFTARGDDQAVEIAALLHGQRETRHGFELCKRHIVTHSG